MCMAWVTGGDAGCPVSETVYPAVHHVVSTSNITPTPAFACAAQAGTGATTHIQVRFSQRPGREPIWVLANSQDIWRGSHDTSAWTQFTDGSGAWAPKPAAWAVHLSAFQPAGMQGALGQQQAANVGQQQGQPVQVQLQGYRQMQQGQAQQLVGTQAFQAGAQMAVGNQAQFQTLQGLHGQGLQGQGLQAQALQGQGLQLQPRTAVYVQQQPGQQQVQAGAVGAYNQAYQLQTAQPGLIQGQNQKFVVLRQGAGGALMYTQAGLQQARAIQQPGVANMATWQQQQPGQQNPQ